MLQVFQGGGNTQKISCKNIWSNAKHIQVLDNGSNCIGKNYTFGLGPKQSLKMKHTHIHREKNLSTKKVIGWIFLFPGPKHNSICSLYEEILFLGVGALCYLKCIWFLWLTVTDGDFPTLEIACSKSTISRKHYPDHSRPESYTVQSGLQF